MNSVLCPPGLPALRHRTFLPFRLQPPVAVPGVWSVFSPGAYRAVCRPHPFLGTRASFGLHHHSEVGHDNRPNRVRHYPADQSFTSRCSPPRLAATQLRSVTKFRPTLTGTSTLPVRCAHRRTSAAIYRRFPWTGWSDRLPPVSKTKAAINRRTPKPDDLQTAIRAPSSCISKGPPTAIPSWTFSRWLPAGEPSGA